MFYGTKIKNCRLRMGLTQQELADKLNVAKSTISLYETGRRSPDNEKLLKIANLFGVSTDYILGQDEASTSIKPADLAAFLNQTEILFDGETYQLNDEAKNKLRNALEFVFWDTKQKNKRKQGD